MVVENLENHIGVSQFINLLEFDENRTIQDCLLLIMGIFFVPWLKLGTFLPVIAHFLLLCYVD